jgi:hypothetical protein
MDVDIKAPPAGFPDAGDDWAADLRPRKCPVENSAARSVPDAA